MADIGASGRVDQVRLQIRLARIGRRYQHDLPRSRHGGSERFRLFQIALHDLDPGPLYRGRLRPVADQGPHRLSQSSEAPQHFTAHISCRSGYKNFVCHSPTDSSEDA